MAVTPSIIKGYKICYAPYAASAPEAAAAEWVELKNCIRCHHIQQGFLQIRS